MELFIATRERPFRIIRETGGSAEQWDWLFFPLDPSVANTAPCNEPPVLEIPHRGHLTARSVHDKR